MRSRERIASQSVPLRLEYRGELAEGDAERMDGAFEALEEVDRHEGLDAFLLAGEGDVAADAFEIVAVGLLVFRESAIEDVVAGGVAGELEFAELFVDAVEGRDVLALGEFGAER